MRSVIPIPAECAELLERQHGVLARWQAPASGPAADSLIRAARWQPLYRGVYAAFTGVPSRHSVLWAAVLRCGPDAVLSHYSASELDHLSDGPAPLIHVTVAADSRRAVPGAEFVRGLPPVAVHRSGRLATARHPARLPPRTRIEETTLDLTQVSASLDQAAAWLATACGRRLTRPERLAAAIRARRRFRWRAELSAALEHVGAGAHSALELRYVRDVERRHGLPAAARQARLVTSSRVRYLDNLYSDYGLAVELDGRIAHPEHARWDDIRRDNALARSGLVTLRYCWTDVALRPCATASEIAAVLRARGWAGQLIPCGTCGSVRSSFSDCG